MNYKDPDPPSRWYEICNRSVPEIINIIERENAIFTCGNCQKMIHSHQFKKGFERIIEPEHWKRTQLIYKIIKRNIESFIAKK